MPPEVAEYFNRTFWLNGKCSWLLTNCYKNNHDISSVVFSFGGGICFSVRFNINFSLRPDNQCLENLYIEVRKLRSKCFLIANWSRPPSSLKCSENVQSRKRSLILKLWLINLMLHEKVEFHLMDGLSCNFASPHNVENTVLI